MAALADLGAALGLSELHHIVLQKLGERAPLEGLCVHSLAESLMLPATLEVNWLVMDLARMGLVYFSDLGNFMFIDYKNIARLITATYPLVRDPATQLCLRTLAASFSQTSADPTPPTTRTLPGHSKASRNRTRRS